MPSPLAALAKIRKRHLKIVSRHLLFFATLLVVLAIPLFLYSEYREAKLTELLQTASLARAGWRARGLVVGLLSADLLLPIPSSAVCAVAGKVFGWLQGTILCWLGLNGSAAMGYLLGRMIGWRGVQLFSDAAAVETVRRDVARWGVWTLVLFRSLPVLAEASVLLAGTYRLPHGKFWLPVLFANLVFAFVFVLLGDWFDRQGLFWMGVGLATAIPVLGYLVWSYLSCRIGQTG
jgi:uncharacterized membrane protein YdjX (TVP38/TMEM64 family)